MATAVVTDIFLLVLFEFLDEMMEHGDGTGKMILVGCLVIPAIILLVQLIFFCIILFRKKTRMKYADENWKVALLSIYSAAILIVIILLAVLTWFVLTFKLDMLDLNFMPRC